MKIPLLNNDHVAVSFVLFAVLTISSCRNSSENGQNGMVLNINSVDDSIGYNFSDFASDFEFIPLETCDESIFDRGKLFVTEKYFLVERESHGVLQFDRKGNFIRTLLRYGKGPKEYIQLGMAVDDQNQRLIASDRFKNSYLFHVDLETGEYIGDIKKAIKVKSSEIYLLSNGNIRIIPSGYFPTKTTPFYFYDQDKNGNLVQVVEAEKGWYNPLIEKTMILHGKDSLYINDLAREILQVDNGHLNRFLSFDFGQKETYDNQSTNNGFIYDFIIRSNLFFSIFEVEESRMDSNGAIFSSGKNTNYVVDLLSGKLSYSKHTFIDPIQTKMDLHERGMITQKNDMVAIKLSSVDFLELAHKALENEDLPSSYKSKLSKITGSINKQSNPIILIGNIQ